ncbi:Ribosomal protein L50, mitochondria [Niveomyces insectorum RCEF 264]|uniref:Large ribosomal subunit protein mL50 n=1 Tax=Niveomyces insectorum RCEF 264 TaxID=1081102 RepID=A0A167ZCA9_9HYPO|nr:Ribosomal protein L50, mitochondria [Niveomyces insectorum RCEF 264]
MRRIPRLQTPLSGWVAPCEAARARPTATTRLPAPTRSYHADHHHHHHHHHNDGHSRSHPCSATARRPVSRTVSRHAVLLFHNRLLSVSSVCHRAEPIYEPTAERSDLGATEADLAAAEAELAAVDSSSDNSDLTSLVIPGPYATAPRPDQVSDATYVPALAGDDLVTVGGLDGWWEDDRHWDRSLEPRAFGPARRVTDPAVLTVLARRAVLEALAVRDAAAATTTTAAADSVTLTGAWRRGGAAAHEAALALQVTVAEDGTVRLAGDVAGVVAGLGGEAGAEATGAEAAEAAEVQDTADAVAEPYMDADSARAQLASWDASWKAVPLDDPAFKFAITKRILQLTGHLLPDAQLAGVQTAGALLTVLVRPPPPAKLAAALQADGVLTGLPNVSVYGRRVTPIDKHKMVGRWKVIVEELEKRGLPVTGTGPYGKMVERKWVYR